MIAIGQDLQVVVFGLGEEEFALPVGEVREILDHRPAFRMPDAPRWLLGLTDVRGTSVPMVDLRARLGLEGADTTLSTRVLVVEVPIDGGEPLVLGLVVDRVLDVSSFGADAIEASPDIGGRWRSEHLHAILRRGSGFIALLDLRRIFADGEAMLIGRMPPAAAA
ncbi:chemotaxis protein CheW [Sphingomonas endophytica]|uniref:Chemotaxis protein CheW n=1 Tax=Sphingomonas endophytica TaxID=869719 RepID=A0A147I6P9_9SPHN|nr:chemotaxis protein CheW [Sphingomonas endophytica]KTT74643.1 chemotaxis protein CheW [Sphingomonas endophytica]